MLEIIKYSIGPFLMIIIFTYFICVVLDKRIKVIDKKFCLLFFLNFICHLIFGVLFDDFYKTVVALCVDSFYCYKVFCISYKRSLYITFCFMILLIIPDLIQLFLVTNVVGINKIICYNEIAGSVISNLMVCIIFIILLYIFKNKVKKIINVEISNNLKILILSLATFFCVGLIFYSVIDTYEFSNDIFLYLIAMLVLSISLFGLIKQLIENNRLMEEYDKLLEFMTTYENEIEKQRILRHEAKNEFLAIKAKLCDKQKDKEIIDYIDEILKEKITVNQEKYAKFGYLPPNGIKGLCYFKVQEAEEKDINVSINISKRIEKSNIYKLNIKNQRDLGKILGVFLDNAIEASSNSTKKQMGIEIYTNKDSEFIMIVSNTFDNNINKGKIGKEKFTTKGKDRGHGLLLVNYIVNKNKIFEISTDITNGIFVQILKIKKLKQ